MKNVIATIIISLMLVACQNESPTNIIDNHKNQKAIQQPSSKLDCTNSTLKKSPPIKDKSKIEAMLLKYGKITTEMTSEEKSAAVNAYIQKKSAAFQNCKKKK
ncbi:MAG: hypothetical protein ACPG52_09890 [Cognaticolwellia sp.]